MRTKYLTREEKKAGQLHFSRFQMLNGAGYNFLGDTIVYLLAIYYGATNIQLGYISSAAFIMGIFLPVVPKLFRGRNLVNVQAFAWFFRGSVGLGYGVLFFLSGQTAVWVILLLYTFFCLFRLTGVVVINPLLNHVSSTRTRGEVTSRMNISFQSVSIVAKVISTLVISLQALSGVIGLIAIQFLGFIVNTVSVFELKKVPCRATVEVARGRNLRTIFMEAMRKKQERTVLLIVWINVSMFVFIGLIIPFLRKEFGLSNSLVMFYSVLTGIAMVLASMYAKAVGDRLGSRPFLLIGHAAMLACLVSWMLIPTSVSFVIVYLLGFASNFFLFSNNLFISRLLLLQIPEDEGVLYNTMSNFVIAIISLVSGLLGGYLIDLGTSLPISRVTGGLSNSYLLFFALAAVVTLSMLLLSYRLSEPGDGPPSSSIRLLFTYQGLKAYVDISRLGKIKNPLKKQTVLHSITDNANDMATEEIRRVLASPLSREKSPVIQSLFHHKRYSLVKQLIAIATDPDSYHQLDAIFALGAYERDEVRETLLKIYQEYENPRYRSSAIKGLSRIGYTGLADDAVREITAGHPIWIQMNYLIALRNMDSSKLFSEGLFNNVRLGKSKTYRQTVYSLYADMLEYEPSLSDIYRERNMRQGQGLKEFLEDSRDAQGVYDRYDEIRLWFRNGDWKAVVLWCGSALQGRAFTGSDENLRRSVMGAGELVGSFDYEDALACFYYTYQLLRERS